MRRALMKAAGYALAGAPVAAYMVYAFLYVAQGDVLLFLVMVGAVVAIVGLIAGGIELIVRNER